MEGECKTCDELRKQISILKDQRNAAIDALQVLRAKYDLREFSAKRYVELQVENVELSEATLLVLGMDFVFRK